MRRKLALILAAIAVGLAAAGGFETPAEIPEFPGEHGWGGDSGPAN
jgi:hypothetical protein